MKFSIYLYFQWLYLVFMIIGTNGYFTIPTVAGWVIQARGAGNYGKT